MDLKEFSGKTVEEAVQKAEAHFGLTRDELKLRVVADEASGQYSIGMERRAVIVARPTPEAAGRARIPPPPPPGASADRPERRDRPGRPGRSDRDRRDRGPRGRSDRGRPHASGDAAGEELYTPQRAGEQAGAAVRGPSTEASQRARAALEGLLEKLPLDGTIEVADGETPDVIELAVNAGSEDFLLGEGGQVLAALTYLVNRMVNKNVRDTKRIAIETAGFRSDHVASLETVARELAEKVRASGEPASLEPMNSYDRRIVHLSLKNAPGITTESEGEGSYKRLVIRPATPGGGEGPAGED